MSGATASGGSPTSAGGWPPTTSSRPPRSGWSACSRWRGWPSARARRRCRPSSTPTAPRGERLAADLRAGAAAENAAQTRLGGGAQAVTRAEVRAQQARDRAHEVDVTLRELAGKLGLEAEPAEEPLPEGERDNLAGRIERLQRRREQLGPVNPLAQDEYAEAIAHVEELEARREDLEDALRELKGLIRDTDKRIREAFEETFTAAAKNFEEVAEQLFPGGRGRLRLVREDAGPRPVLGGVEPEESPSDEERLEAAVEAEESGDPDDGIGVEIEITPAGKSTKRLTLLSGGEKSLTALAFLFAVFLARPCPFYILDEVEAALDDLNIDRFLGVLRRFSDRAQFIVVTHQKRTMEAADCLVRRVDGRERRVEGRSRGGYRRASRPSASAVAARGRSRRSAVRGALVDQAAGAELLVEWIRACHRETSLAAGLFPQVRSGL